MNYLSKCIISVIKSNIYNIDSYELGKIIGERIKILESGNVEGANRQNFLRGVGEGIADHKMPNTESNETIS